MQLKKMLAACGFCCFPAFAIGDFRVSPLTSEKSDLSFECRFEIIPEPSPHTDVLFKLARWMQNGNQLKRNNEVNIKIERLYRIAAENGHFKANINLQNGGLRGIYNVGANEHIRLSEQLIKKDVASGYYFFGFFLENGVAGLIKDEQMALRYFRKAADTGSAQAQQLIGKKLAPKSMAPDIARQMRRCAAEQGNGEAAMELAINLGTKRRFPEALEVYQLGTAAGNSTSASFLSKAFRGPKPDDQIYYLAQEKDLERADRYEKIWRILANYSHANPKVPEINEILPLPPAPLPEWDGKLQWLEARLANVPPPKPSEVLIHALAKEKGLDPATGKPMPGSPVFSQANFPVLMEYSGNPCPESGYWKVIWSSNPKICAREVIQYVEQDQPLPTARVERLYRRPWPLSHKITQQEERVKWGLLG